MTTKYGFSIENVERNKAPSLPVLSAMKHVAQLAKQTIRLTLLVTSVVLLSACSILDLVNHLPTDSRSTVEKSVSYGEHPRAKLDIYRPLAPSPSSAIIIYFYGGGWVDGDRDRYEFIARKLADMGHYVVVPDYRLFPEVVFPSFVEDGASATDYILDNLTTIANGSRPVFLMGHSAGAHIAAMIALDPRFLARFDRHTDELTGFIGLAGPYDFLPITSKRVGLIFPETLDRQQSQPITFIGPNDPPLFLAHGDNDRRVWLRNSVNLAEATKDFPIPATLHVYAGMSHAEILRPFIPLMKDPHGLLIAISNFIDAQLD